MENEENKIDPGTIDYVIEEIRFWRQRYICREMYHLSELIKETFEELPSSAFYNCDPDMIISKICKYGFDE